MARPLDRITSQTRRVLSAFMESPTEEQYGLEIATACGLRSGSLYPILDRLEDRGWLRSRWEDVDPASEGRPRRRYYRLTDGGIDLARQTLPAGEFRPTGLQHGVT